MSYLLDTNICIALLKGNNSLLTEKVKSLSPSEFFLCSIVKAELVFGARHSQKIDENLVLLKAFFNQFDSLPFDDRAVDFYGIIRALLTKAGTPIGANDLFIASIAQAHEMTLLTRNHKEFSRVPNLRLEYW